MDPKSHHNLPSESTIARETEDAIKISSCQIWIEEGTSIPSKDVRRMRMEFHHSPYRSLQMKLQDMLFEKIEEPLNCCIVYVRSFTNSGHDFVYCIPGRTHLAKFYGGTYGTRDYKGPVFAALVVLAGTVIERVGPINWRNYTKVPKYTEKVNGVRWRYLFATARQAWSTMSFEASDLSVLEAMVADAPVQQQEPEPEARLPDAISDSQYPPEAQRIAIHQNVELLKKKPNHHDRVFEYLEIELSGRSNRQGKDELTKQQYRLVERLRDNADDFDILYTDEDKNRNTIRKADFSREEEARLISERDVIIREIQEQLALPITVRDDSDDSYLSRVAPSGTPDVPRDTKDSYSSDEDNLLVEPIDVTSLEADLILRLSNFTGASPHQCEGYLFTADWDLELALSYFQEDQARLKPSVVCNTNTPGPKERVDAVATFKALTNADPAVASSYLTDAGWNVGIAVSTFFDDAESPGADSKSADVSLNRMSSKLSAKINQKPVRQIPPYTSNTTIRAAGGHTILGASLRASIHRRIAELDAEITKIDKRLEGVNDDGLDVIMRDVAESMKESNEDNGSYTGPRGKLRVNEDPSPAVTGRKGISHAGLPLVLDEAGNVVSYKNPTGASYQQYLAMRLRLQVQYYGHEIVPSDDDPHHGIPTRERCPAPLVQEEVSDSSSSSSSSSSDAVIPLKKTDLSASQAFASKTAQVQRRHAAMKEMVELMDLVVGSHATEVTRSIEEANAANALTRLKDQRPPNWAEQARQAIQHVRWQDLARINEDDEIDSVLGSTDESEEDAASIKNVDKEGCAPIKAALKATSRPRKLSMKVRFNLSDGERDMPTTCDERSKDVEERSPRRGRPVLRSTRRSARLRMKVRGNAAEDEKKQSTQTQADKEMTKAQEEEAEVHKRRNLFISKQEDAWDGLDGDEGELELESESWSNVDAEGEEKEIEEQQEEGMEEQQEKDKRPPRVDEKMED